jgi:hypothetical protein
MDHGEALALIIAASADETTKQRLADLSKAQSAHDMALRAAQDQAQVNARTVQEARQQVAAALEMAASTARRIRSPRSAAASRPSTQRARPNCARARRPYASAKQRRHAASRTSRRANAM